MTDVLMRRGEREGSHKPKNDKGHWEPPGDGRRKEIVLPYGLQGEHGPVNTLISDL